MNTTPQSSSFPPPAGVATGLPPEAVRPQPQSHFSCHSESSLHHPHETTANPALPPLPERRHFDEWEPSGDPMCDLSQEFRHSGWQQDRTKVYHALMATGKSNGRLKAFCQCGMNAIVMRSKIGPEDYKITALRCHDRFCKVCSREKSYRVLAKLLPAIGRQRVRMLTLTLKADSDAKLCVLVTKLIDSFRQLRRLKLWTDHVRGEAHFLEITRGQQHDHWHAHLHVLMIGEYIEVGWVGQAWHGITQTSTQVHITLAKSINGVAAYVGKYATKGFDATTLKDQALLQEAMIALQGKRMMDATGCVRKAMSQVEDTECLSPAEWEPVMSLGELFKAACGGNLTARRITTLLRVKDPTTGDYPPWYDSVRDDLCLEDCP